jgi:hypothetical protein
VGNSIYWGKFKGRLRDEVARYVPRTWDVELRDVSGRPEVDAFLVVRAADGGSSTVSVEFKAELTPKAADEAWRRIGALEQPALLVAPAISERTQAYLRERGIWYLDFTGNAWWRLDAPALAVSVTSDASAPRPEARRRRLRGAKAGRLVRYLCDLRPPFTVSELSATLSIDMGNVSRYLELLHKDALVTRAARGPVTAVDWEAVLRRWSDDYRRPVQERFLAPRGQEHFLRALRATRQRYALSGVAGATRYAPYTADVSTFCYCDDLHTFAKAFGLQRAERAANVVLALPFDDAVYDRSQTRDGLAVAAPSQAAVDLLSGRGRELQQAEELLRWMREHESAWRT